MSEQAVVHEPSSSCPGAGHQTGLHRAAMVGNSDVIKALIQGGCAVDLQDRDGNTALHEASWHGFCHCVKPLVRAGADVHIRNKAGNTALHLACQNAHAQTARLLLLGGSKPHTKNHVGDTCLHVAARYNNVTLVRILISSLCPVSERNQVGDTALHVAAALNHKRTIQLLLEAGADGTARNKAGKTALDKARDNNQRDVSLLLARAPQMHRFMRGRTIRKRRERVRTANRSQSNTRAENQPNSSSVEEMAGRASAVQVVSDGNQHHQQQQSHQKTPAIPIKSSSHNKRRRVRALALNADLGGVQEDLLPDGGDDSIQEAGTSHLFTLYRDENGDVRQAPANSCNCKLMLRRLVEHLHISQEEVRSQLLDTQQQVNRKLLQMDRRRRHQIKVLDMLNQERAAAERKSMTDRMQQRAAEEREEALLTQAVVTNELKRWCLSQLKDMDVNIPVRGQYYKLLPSPSLEPSVDAGLESLPLLPLVSGDSSTSLATYVNILPSTSSQSEGRPEQEQLASRTYFEVKVDRSPGDYENTALLPLPAENTWSPLWHPRAVQHSPAAAAVPLLREGLSSSSSNQGSALVQNQEHGSDRRARGLMRDQRFAGIPTDGTRTLEFFSDRPTEPTFSQERNNMHAKEVTQRFFETVSAQLERWYERKVVEVEQQAELRARQDRTELLQQISMLEEELQKLVTNEKAES